MATSITVSKQYKKCLVCNELTKPVVDPKVREKIPNSQVRPSKILADEEKNANGDGETQITQEDQLGVLRLIQWT